MLDRVEYRGTYKRTTFRARRQAHTHDQGAVGDVHSSNFHRKSTCKAFAHQQKQTQL